MPTPNESALRRAAAAAEQREQFERERAARLKAWDDERRRGWARYNAFLAIWILFVSCATVLVGRWITG